jgi:tetratricopeptide (TPR) repeat protein
MNIKELVFGGVIGAILGVLAAVFLQKPLETWWNDYLARRHKPQDTLEEATKNRRLMTDAGFESAQEKYRSLIDNPDVDHALKVQAYQGMSRTYSEWAVDRFWRGLSKTQYSENAEEYGLSAEHEDPGQFETALALAYSYESKEIDTAEKASTLQKVKDLIAIQHNFQNPNEEQELQFLIWMTYSDKERASFAAAADPQKIDNLMILVELSRYFTYAGARGKNQSEKDANFRRADAFLAKASQIAPGNEVVSFRRGYLAQANDQWAAAESFYNEALTKERDFPIAHNNLAAIFGSKHQYDQARIHLKDTIAKVDAPVNVRYVALINLGEVDLESSQSDEACKEWKEARKFAKDDDAAIEVYLALCSYLSGDMGPARQEFAVAVKLGRSQGMDLGTINFYRDTWKVGSHELELEGKLIKMVKEK